MIPASLVSGQRCSARHRWGQEPEVQPARQCHDNRPPGYGFHVHVNPDPNLWRDTRQYRAFRAREGHNTLGILRLGTHLSPVKLLLRAESTKSTPHLPLLRAAGFCQGAGGLRY